MQQQQPQLSQTHRFTSSILDQSNKANGMQRSMHENPAKFMLGNGNNIVFQEYNSHNDQ